MVVRELRIIEEIVPTVWEWSVFKEQMAKLENISPVSRSKRSLPRRQGACTRCRKSKLKCDGKLPSCTACLKQRPKSNSRCEYPPLLTRRKAGSLPPELDFIQHDIPPQQESPPVGTDDKESHRGPPCVLDDNRLFGVYSMVQCIDLFKSIAKKTDNDTSITSIAQCSGREAFEAEVTASASAQEFVSRDNTTDVTPPFSRTSISAAVIQSMPTYLSDLYRETLRLQWLISVGKLMKAWIDMPRLVRLAQLDRLDHTKRRSESPPGTDEGEIRRRVWWLMLELDVQISMQIGRPLAMRVELGIDRPTLDGLEGLHKELEQAKLDFNQYALEVLGQLCTDDKESSDQLLEAVEEIAHLERLEKMEKRLPQLPKLQEEDKSLAIAVGNHKIELLAFKMLLCSSLAKLATDQQTGFSSWSLERESTREKVQEKSGDGVRERSRPRKETYPYQSRILSSARSIIDTFDHVVGLDPDDKYITWDRFFDTYCAAAVLAIAFLRRETSESSDLALITTSLSLFSKVSQRNPVCHLAAVATRRIEALSTEALTLRSTHNQKRKHGDETLRSTGVDQVAARASRKQPTIHSSTPSKRRRTDSRSVWKSAERKTPQPNLVSISQEPPALSGMFGSTVQAQLASEGAQIGMMPEQQFYQPPMAGPGNSTDELASVTTSFAEGMDTAHYPTYWTYPAQPNTSPEVGVQWAWYHPPLAQPHPPMVNLDMWGLPLPVVEEETNIQQLASPYEANVSNNRIAHLSRAATMSDIREVYAQPSQNPAALSLPVTPTRGHPSRHTQFHSDTQASQVLDARRFTNIESLHGVPASSQESDPWEWVQQQQSSARRNSTPAVPVTTGYYDQLSYSQAYDIPTTTGAWG